MKCWRVLKITLLSTMLWITSLVAHAFSPYSNRELDQLEKEFVEQINQSPLIIRDPLAKQYIQHLAQLLSKHGSMPTPDFFIVNSNEINAFAGPGGHIGINTQLILASDNESELAAVMAHEMSHVRLHHLYRMLEHEKQMKIPMLASMLASIALGAVNPMLGTGALMATLGGFAQNDISYVRSNEKEADRIGIDMLYRSGLDPRGMAGFFKKMQLNTRYYYSANIPAILRTHPIDEDRIAEAEDRCAQMKLHEVPDDLDYHLFKELIRTTVSSDEKTQIENYQRCIAANPNELSCQFGYGLSLMNINQFEKAEQVFQKLAQSYPQEIYFTIALTRAENGHQHATQAIQQLQALQVLYPDHLAILTALAESYTAANQPGNAAAILLKASRIFPHDLSICEALARAEAQNQRKDYAYFTAAQCQILQGQRREARRLLKLAQSITKKDIYLKARIEAKLDEMKD